jgi:regulator of sirC expression with transglutaminase-like and TPR domain
MMNLDHALSLLARDADAPLDLAELALTLARDEYPELDVEAYLAELDGMAREAQAYLGGGLETGVNGLCRYLFHEMGFRGNAQAYYDPRNSYLNDVLDRRIGIPITLTAIAIAVGNRAGLEVVGVGLPGHFIAKARAGEREVLFDPFHGGRILVTEQCEQLVQRITGTEFIASTESLQASTLGLVVFRMLTNLKSVYLSEGDLSRATRVMGRLLQLRPDDPLQLRDLGTALLQGGQPGPAIDSLEAYLAARPDANDAQVVREMLKQSQQAVARWN